MKYGNELEVKRLQTFPNAKLPTRNYDTDAGADLYAANDVCIKRGETAIVETGIAISIPEGFVGKIESRSSLALNGLVVAGGVIDNGYTGQIKIIMNNFNAMNDRDPVTLEEYYHIKAGDKVAQLLIYAIETPKFAWVETLHSSERGMNGLGSSGKA